MPTLAALRTRGDEVVEPAAAPRTRAAGSRSRRADRERVELLARTAVKRLLHEPTLRVRQLDAEHRHARLQLLRELFGLDEPAAAERPAGGEVRPLRRATRVDAAAGGHPRQRARPRPGALGGRPARRRGDRRDRRPRGDQARGVGDKSRWVDAIEAALVAGEIDLAVHSAKDVPAELATAARSSPRRRERAPVAGRARAMPRDAAACGGRRRARRAARRRPRRDELAAPPGAAAAPCGPTSRWSSCAATSTRGCASSTAARPTRIVLAAAGLERLGTRATSARRSTVEFVPAPGQGTLALEARADDERVRAAVQVIHDAARSRPRGRAGRRARIGRDLSHAGGSPRRDGTIRGFVGLPDGSAWVRDELAATAGEALARRSCSPRAPASCCAPARGRAGAR